MRLTSELVLSLRDRVSGPARQVGGALSKLEHQTRTVGAGLARRDTMSARAFGAMSDYAKDAAKALLPVAAGFAAADIGKTAASFETSLSNIAKKGDLSAEALAKVKDEILGMVESGKVAMDPAEIAGAYERGIAAGIPLENMREFTLLSAQAADAWEMTGADVGNAFAGFNTTMGVKFEEMRAYADLINSLADAGISDEKDIVTFIDNAGAGLKQFGMAKETIAGVGAALLDMKMPAETAARMMGIVANKLLAPENLGDEAFGTFTEFVGDLKTFKKEMKNDPTKGFVKFMEKLQDLDKFKQAQVVGKIFGAEWTDEIQRMLGGWERVQRNMQFTTDPTNWLNSLGASYDKKLQTVESKWKVFTANLEKMKIDLGDLILAPSGNFLAEATRGVNELSNTIKGLKTTWETLKSAVEQSSSGSSTFLDNLNPLGPPTPRANDLQRQMIKELGDRKPGDRAVGAFGARDMEGVTAAKALAATRNTIRRRLDETPSEKRERDYQTTRVMGHRQAEAESMKAMKEQFGTYLNPDGQSFKRGTEAQDLVDEALTKFSTVLVTAAEVIGKATGRPVSPEDLGRATGAIPVPSQPTGPVPTARPDIVGPVAQEGEAAVLKATELGQRITDAFSVSATPQVNSGPLDSYIGKLRTAIGLQNQLAERGGRVGGGADYSAAQADVED